MENNALTTETQYADIDNKKIGYRKIGNGGMPAIEFMFIGKEIGTDELIKSYLETIK